MKLYKVKLYSGGKVIGKWYTQTEFSGGLWFSFKDLSSGRRVSVSGCFVVKETTVPLSACSHLSLPGKKRSTVWLQDDEARLLKAMLN